MAEDYDFLDTDVIKAASEAEAPAEIAETPAETPAEAPETPDPAPQEAAAPETQEAPQEAAQQPERQTEGRTVPLQALDAERFKRKQLQEELETLKAQQQKPEAPAPLPDALTEPDKFAERYQQDLSAQTSEVQQLRQMFQEQQRVAHLSAQMSELGRQQRAINPDYDDAASFVESRIRAEIEFANPGVDPVQVTQEVTNRLLSLTQNELAAGRNPAERLYEYAGMIGYQKPAPAAEPAKTAPLSNLEKAAQAAKSVANSGGPAATPTMTLDDAANMNAFDIASMSEADIRRLMTQG